MEKPIPVLEPITDLAGSDIQHATFNAPNVHDIEPLETFGRASLPGIANL